MAKACPRCGSNRWRRAPGGTRVCEEGHVDMSYRRETIDTGAATKSLRVRREKRHRVRKDRTDHRVYWGKELEYLHYELVVLLVRHQTAALRRLWNLPPTFEIIVRDLLQLLLQLYPLPPTPGPLLSSGSTMNEAPRSASAGSAARQRRPSQPALPQSPRKRGFEDSDDEGVGDAGDGVHQGSGGRLKGEGGLASSSSDESSTEGSETEAEDDDDDVRKNVEAAHAASSSSSSDVSSTSDDGEERDPSRADLKADFRKPPKKPMAAVKRRLKPVHALAVVLLGAYAVRAPFLLTEVVALVNARKLPYLDFAYSDLIPADMRVHFNAHVYSAMSPAFAPSVNTLHQKSRELASKLHKAFGVAVPELNVAPVLWHCCRALGLSPIFYALAKQVAFQLDLHFSLSPALAAHPYPPSAPAHPSTTSSADGAEGSNRRPRVLHGDAVPPELAAMCSCVIAAKLVYFQPGLGGAAAPVAVAEKGKGIHKGPGAVWDAVERAGGGEGGGEGVLGRSEWSRNLKVVLEGIEAGLGEDRLAAGDFDPLELTEGDLDRYLELAGDILQDGMPPPKAYDTMSALPLPSAPPSLPPPPPPAHALFPPLYRAASAASSKNPALPPSFPQVAVDAAPRSYPVFAPEDHTGVLPPAMRVLADVAARTVGVSVEDVMRALGSLEGRLVRKEEARRLAERKAAKEAAATVAETAALEDGLMTE